MSFQLKKQKLNTIFKEVLDEKFIGFYQNLGFKYYKSKRICTRKRQTIDQLVGFGLDKYSGFEVEIEERVNLFINVKQSTIIGSDHFEKWLNDNFNERGRYRTTIDQIVFKFKLDSNQFIKEDFIQMKDLRKFKNKVSKSITNESVELKIFENIKEGQIYWEEEIFPQLEEKSNWNFLWETRPNSERISIQSCRLLIYLQRYKEAKLGYEKIFELCEQTKSKFEANLPSQKRLKEFESYYGKIRLEYDEFLKDK